MTFVLTLQQIVLSKNVRPPLPVKAGVLTLQQIVLSKNTGRLTPLMFKF